MKSCDIINTLAQKVIDTIYGEWHHEGRIEIEHSDDFWFSLDGRLYKVKLENWGSAETANIEEAREGGG